MRIILGLLSGIIGMLAGWAGLAFLAISISGMGPDGGAAMGAFFGIGPFGGVIGFALGVILFLKLGLRHPDPTLADRASADAVPVQSKTPISQPFATVILTIAAVLFCWGWYEFNR